MDMERVALLLGIIASLADHGPAFKNIRDEAMAELKDINDGIADKPGMPEPVATAPIEPRAIRASELPSQTEHPERR